MSKILENPRVSWPEGQPVPSSLEDFCGILLMGASLMLKESACIVQVEKDSGFF
jgi:hypothetical protein